MVPVVLGLSLLTIPSSLPIALNSGGTLGSALYVALVPAAFSALAAIERVPGLAERVQRQERAIFVLATVVLVVAFAIRYPLSQAGLLGIGTDRDEALDIALARLLDGQFPYYGRTQFGNALTPMPGALLLAAPFHLAGASAWQNLLWMPVALLLLADAARALRTRMALAVVALFASPAVLQDHMHGGDLAVNAIYVAAALWLLHRVASAEAPRSRALMLAAAVLAVAVASRPVFAAAAVLGTAYMLGRHGPRAGALFAAVLASVIGALVLPFLLYDAAAFFPQHLVRKLPAGWSVPSYVMIGAGLLVAALPAVRPVSGLPALYAVMAASLGLMLALPIGIRAMSSPSMLPYLIPAGLFGVLALLPACRPGYRVVSEISRSMSDGRS